MIQTVPYEKIKFPCGEIGIKIYDPESFRLAKWVDIRFEFERLEEIVELILICDAFRRNKMAFNLIMPYVPFGRQDRVTQNGEAFSLAAFAEIINGLGAQHVVITDPHSDVTTALIKNCIVIEQSIAFVPHFKICEKGDFWLVSPDGGALKKIYKLAEQINPVGVIECSKLRNVKTGEITGVKIHASGDLCGEPCYIVDDICDGGRTFIEIAKELKKINAGKIVLMVTHGFFTKGIEVFDGLIDEIFTRKGRVK